LNQRKPQEAGIKILGAQPLQKKESSGDLINIFLLFMKKKTKFIVS
jgi:hypothetical protein